MTGPLRIPALLMLMVLGACEKQAVHIYKFANNSSAAIKIVFKPASDNSDRSLTIGSNQTTEFYTDKLGLGRVSKYKQKGQTLTSFSKLDIFKNDSVKSKTDFTKTNVWTYQEINRHSGNYTASIKDSDF